MAIVSFWYGAKMYKIRDDQDDDEEKEYSANDVDFQALYRASAVTCDAIFEIGEV